MQDEETGPGRPEYIPTKSDREWVTRAATIGVPQDLIRVNVINPETDLAVSLKTLRKHYRKELDFGLAELAINLLQPAYSVAMDKDHPDFARLNIWAQKSRLGLKETTVQEITGPDGESVGGIPQLVVIMDGNKDPEE